MNNSYSDIRDRLGFLDTQLKDARESGLLGETGPHVDSQRRDDQAEEIAEIVSLVNELMTQPEREESAPEPPPAFSIRAIFTALFGPPRINEEKNEKNRIDALVAEAFDLKTATSRFRERYKFIYKAAFYAILPERTAVEEDSCDYITTRATVGIGFSSWPLLPLRTSLSKLDASHLLDLNVTSLSAKMARTLDTLWIQGDEVDARTRGQIERAGDLFQEILLASQGSSLSRTAVSRLLVDISRMVETLEISASQGFSTEMAFISSLDSKWREGCACDWRDGSSRYRSQASVPRQITTIPYRLMRVAQGYILDTTGFQKKNDLSIENISENGLTFATVAEKMQNHCTVEKFHGKVERQKFSSGVARREGSYAHVWRVRLEEQRNLGETWSFNEVAVKVLRNNGDTEQSISLRAFREFVIWGQMNHPNIVPLVGLWFDFGSGTGLPAFVSPWLEYGSLTIYLSEIPDIGRPERLHLLVNIAAALAYMHNHHLRVCHGDINPENILVSNGNAFICDFGISHTAAYNGYTTNPHGSWRYRAPEQLIQTKSKPTPQSDMYSFGLLCYKVLTGLDPWDGMIDADRCRTPSPKLRRPDSVLADDYELVQYCCMDDPRLRAAARIAIGRLNELVE